MPFFDLLRLAFRNLREAKLRATLTSMGVIVGVAVIVTMVSFGLGLQRNLLSRFKALDLFNEMTVFGKSFAGAFNFDRPPSRRNQSNDTRRSQTEEALTRILDDAAIADIGKIPGVAYIEPTVWFVVQLRSNGHTFGHQVAGANVPNSSSHFKEFDAGQMISSPSADEAVVTEDFVRTAGFASAGDAVGKTIEFLTTGSAQTDKSKQSTTTDDNEPPNFFGIPLSEEDFEQKDSRVVAERTFRIAGVLKEAKPDGGPGPTRGLMPYADVYIPVATARQWSIAHQGEQSRCPRQRFRRRGA